MKTEIETPAVPTAGEADHAVTVKRAAYLKRLADDADARSNAWSDWRALVTADSAVGFAETVLALSADRERLRSALEQMLEAASMGPLDIAAKYGPDAPDPLVAAAEDAREALRSPAASPTMIDHRYGVTGHCVVCGESIISSANQYCRLPAASPKEG